MATPPAAVTGEQEDMSNREDVNMSTGGQVDSATSEPVDTSTGGGDPFYCGERKLGTWFYCERPKPKPSEPAASPSAASPTYRQRLDKIGARLEELKAKAILEPSSDNIIAYVRYQREQLDRASTFADVWERAIWQHPDLDYTLQRPVSTLGKTAWLEQRKNDREAVIASLSQRYGLFFFYSSSCGACEVFSPIVRSLSDKYHLSVLPVSMDGGPTPAFPRYVVNQGQYEKMGLEGGQVPALVLFDTYLKKPIPIGYGVMAEDEVLQRIFYLTSVKPGSDF
ncbi:MAG: conjugal transfer protein TraF [Sphingomonadales bacterium]|nr:conjugal transfer protein TraF [Sphingomonadales bacterium]MDE2171785.1 conjugal transfer protein TraF [Sphingomonadales bacterium]